MTDTNLDLSDADDLIVLRQLAASDSQGQTPDLASFDDLFPEGGADKASWVVERLYRDGYLTGIDAQTMAGFNLLRIRLTPSGRERLRQTTTAAVSARPAILLVEERRDLEPLLQEIRRLLDSDIAFGSADDEADFTAQLETVETQLRSPRPRRGIVREAIDSLRSIGESVVASAVWASLIEVSKRL